MYLDPTIHSFTGILLTIIILGIILKFFKIPYVMAYLLAGIIIGPYGLGVIQDHQIMLKLESIGVMFLLFFVGMKVSASKLIANWKIEIVGTFIQILGSLLCVAALSLWLDWSLDRVILLGFVISISSTAVVLKILEDRNETDSEIGRNVIGILLIQDLALIPMIIIIEFLGGKSPAINELVLQIIGGATTIGFIVWLSKTKVQLKLPLSKLFKKDHELQVFAALLLCFGLAFISELFHLSSAIGAFTAGIIVASTKETDWVSKSLQPFYILFVSLFFVSIGMLIDPKFLVENFGAVLIMVFAALLTNTFINAFILKFLGLSWKESLYAGGLLSQIGEFSFVLISIGLQFNSIGEFEYQMVIYTIACTLLLCPIWISCIQYFCAKKFDVKKGKLI
jgi:CPA2 family monovalent cation:H+ antiporter-2